MGDLFLEEDGVRTEADAMKMSLIAALQRNKTYRDETPEWKREAFRNEWATLIRDKSKRYAQSSQAISDDEHCAAIEAISSALTDKFSDVLDGARLRLGTSQKAFNSYLKYLWRLGMAAMPPHCPIDSIVLMKVGIYASWTKCDSRAEYLWWNGRIRCKAKAKSQSVAEWEYEVWQPEAMKRRSTVRNSVQTTT